MPTATAPFGRVLTAMVTPFTPAGDIDFDAVQALARYLADRRHDGLVLNGTTGESATTSDAEKRDILEAVKEAVGDRLRIVAGVGSNDTAHTLELTRQAAEVGVDGMLVVTPYYTKPPQAGLVAHFTAVADETDVPVMIYDIPGRTGISITTPTLIELGEHPNIVAVKDAKGDLWAAAHVMRATDLAWYSGDDGANLSHLTQGAVGIVGVTAHIASLDYAEMLDAIDRGDLATAIAIHRRLVPAVDAIMGITQGAISVKAALADRGILPSETVRLPLVPTTESERAAMRAGIDESALS